MSGADAGAVRRELQAFLDESQSDRTRDPYCYMLAAGVCAAEDMDTARAAMEQMLLPGQLKVHWRDEAHRRRRRAVETVAALPLQHVVVVRDGRAGEAGERQRRHCLERMLFELGELKVHTATFESRGAADDRRDRAMLDALRARKIITPQLRVAHTPGPKDALLWVPDIVCGAITQQRTGNAEYLTVLESQVEVITISAE